MKKIIVLGLLFVLSSCQKNEILLPVANETIIADAKEYSPIYFLFKAEEKDTLIEINSGNLKSSENLVFNIDKRLPLRRVILEIKKLESNKYVENYFSYTDTMRKTVAFLPFKKSKYKLEKPDFNMVYFYLDRNDLVHFKDKVFSTNELQAFLDNQSGQISVFFAYDKGMSFGKYIQYQFFVKSLVAQKGSVINSKKEYIY